MGEQRGKVRAGTHRTAGYTHLIQEGSGQRGPLVEGHGNSGGGAVAAEPGPFVRLGTAG